MKKDRPRHEPRTRPAAGPPPTSSALSELARAIPDDPNGLSTEEICRSVGKTPQELGDSFEALRLNGRILGFAGLWLTPTGFKLGSDQYLTALRSMHESQPQEAGLEAEKVAKSAGLKWAGKPLDRILSRLVETGKIERLEGRVALRGFRLELSPRRNQLLQRVIEVLEAYPVETPTPHEIAQQLGVPRQAVEEILKLGALSGEIVPFSEAVYYTPKQIDALRLRIREISRGKSISATQLRDALGTTRKYAIPLVEQLVEQGRRPRQD